MNSKKFISFILALVLICTSCFWVNASDDITEPNQTEVTENAENPFEDFVVNNISDYKKMLVKLERPTVTTTQFINFIKIINFPFRLITGRAWFPEEHFNVTVDVFIQSLSDQVLEESGLDVAAILTNVPDINAVAELAVKVFNINTEEFRDQMYAKRDELWKTGDDTMATLYHFLGAYLSVIEKCELYAEPTDNPDVYEVKARYIYKDGETEILRPGFYINTVTGECTNKNDSGVMGTGFNFSITEMMVYATSEAWMKDFGFCLFYDLAANSMPLLWNYNTRRFKFDYDGLEWMVQIWKGNYLIANGAEVGLYNREPDKFGTFYNCAENDRMIPMSMQLYAGDKLIVEQEEQMHWWINGFRINGVHYPISSLTLFFTFEMPDEEMLNAFCKAIDKNFRKDVKYKVNGLKIIVAW